jgi:Tfp pilus assembly protein PilE
MNKKGFTLIELIIFILVGAVFLPFTYVVFTSVVKGSMKPETALILRTIVETKMNDINNMSYDSMVSSGYTNVTSDPRFSDPQFPSAPNPYSGYQWRWEVDYVAYKDEPNPPTCADSHCKTTVSAVLSWAGGAPRKIGDYATPSDYLVSSDHHNFYRVYYSLWTQDRRYRVSEIDGASDMVRPTTANGYYYKAVQPPLWAALTRYKFGDMVRPTVANGHYYKSMAYSQWVPANTYAVGDAITVPSVQRNFIVESCNVMCAVCSSSSSQPPWPDIDLAPASESCINWRENTQTGSSPPIWRTDSIPFVDGGIRWQEDTTLRSSNSGTGPSGTTYPIFDGSLTWEPHHETTLQSNSSEPSWQPDSSVPSWRANISYGLGTMVRPTYTSNRLYMCTQAGISGGIEPWPLVWPIADAYTVLDGSAIWQEKSTITDNNVSWLRSSVYKQIKVYVAPPGCAADSCAYTFTAVSTTRDYATRP